MVKISIMTAPEGLAINPLASADPHADQGHIPRASNPLSFLSKSAFLLAIAALATNAITEVQAQAQAAGSSSECVCKYDPAVDYFPNKISPDFSDNFRIDYFKSYKTITVIDNNVEYVTYAYLCGTPLPNLGTLENTIQIPVKNVAVTSTTLVSYIEYLGERESLRFVSATNNNYKSCVRKLYDQGLVVDGTSLNAARLRLANASSYSANGQPLDVVFMDSYNYKSSGLRNTVTNTLGLRTKSIYIAEQLEFSPLGKLEWVELVAALYNKEYEVINLAARLNSRYDCVKNLVAKTAPQPSKKKVLWGYCYFDTWRAVPDTVCYMANCPNYYCDLVKDAGGEIINGTSSAYTTDQFYAMAEDADVWIYTDANFLQPSQYAPIFFNGTIAEKFSQLPVVQNKQVFDYLGRHSNDWFDDAKAEPGVVLMDLVQALYGDQYIPQANRTKDFLRNVFTEAKGNQEPRLGSECVDASAPLYNAWDEGFCLLPNFVADKVKPDVPLCAGAPTTTAAPTIKGGEATTAAPTTTGGEATTAAPTTTGGEATTVAPTSSGEATASMSSLMALIVAIFVASMWL